jgi:hypothetical protein
MRQLTRLYLRGGLGGIVAMGDAIRIDTRSAPAALGEGPHDDHLGPLQVVRGNSSGMEGQGDESVRSALRAWPHDPLMMAGRSLGRMERLRIAT